MPRLPIDVSGDRARVVAAADELFNQRGVHAVNLRDITHAAGISTTRLYAQFSGKEEVVLAVLHDRHEQWHRGLTAFEAAIEDPGQRLLAVFDFLDVWFRSDDFYGCGFINVFGELGRSSPAVRDVVRAHKSSTRAHIDALVAEARLPVTLGPVIALLAEGAQVTSGILGTTVSARQARDAAARVVATSGAAGTAQKTSPGETTAA